MLTVHPRSRGEHRGGVQAPAHADGSSPLARGTLGPRCQRARPVRFIPARAGNTQRLARRPRHGPVHPRSRGEHRRWVVSSSRPSGSSPLARGTPYTVARTNLVLRFIPARAGNTPMGRGWPAPSTVHPRSRGEHAVTPHDREKRTGSSPLARGTQELRRFEADSGRFIPARAGNTFPGGAGRIGSSVHPRSRGEHGSIINLILLILGSSPLARGTPPTATPAAGRFRFIPARAGNTPHASSPVRTTSVHPRSRGEHELPLFNGPEDDGSSPLARGTPWRCSRDRRSRRFIPARAGNTTCRRAGGS